MISQDFIPINPLFIYKKITFLLDRIYEDFDCDQIKNRKKYHLEAFKIIKDKLIELLKSKNFWTKSMNIGYCDYEYKRGPMKGMICNKRIYINCDEKNGKYRCYDHISKTIYKSNRRELNKDKLCIEFRKYGTQLRPCGNYKQYGDYCLYHIVRPKKVSLNDAYFTYYFNKHKKVSLGNAYFKEIILKRELDILYNIDINIFDYEIDFKLENKYCKYCEKKN